MHSPNPICCQPRVRALGEGSAGARARPPGTRRRGEGIWLERRDCGRAREQNSPLRAGESSGKALKGRFGSSGPIGVSSERGPLEGKSLPSRFTPLTCRCGGPDGGGSRRGSKGATLARRRTLPEPKLRQRYGPQGDAEGKTDRGAMPGSAHGWNRRTSRIRCSEPASLREKPLGPGPGSRSYRRVERGRPV